MIPKRAIFCWSSYDGKEMSWLRLQSIKSFQIMNPDWEIHIANDDNRMRWPIHEGFRWSVLRSDYWRYCELYEKGGVYFDTDIVFVKPIPSKWLDASLFAPLVGRTIDHIACLGGLPRHPFWDFVARRCILRETTGMPLDCQAFGTKLLHGIATPSEMASIPVDAFLVHPWDRIEYLWADKPFEIPSNVIGVHWYGGDRLSQDMEPEFSEDRRPPCLVSKALAVALAVQ